MKPSKKNLVINGIVSAYLYQKALEKKGTTDFASAWKVFNGASRAIGDLYVDESAFTILSGLNCTFGVFNCHYKDGHRSACIVWIGDGYLWTVDMMDEGALPFYRTDLDGKTEKLENDDTASTILAVLVAIENGGGSASIDPTEAQTFSGGVTVTTEPLRVESKLVLPSASNVTFEDGSSLGGGTEVSIVRY